MRKMILHTRIVFLLLLCLLLFNIPPAYCLFDDFFAKRQIVKWNESNAENVYFDIRTTANYRKDPYYYYFCLLNGTIKNNTKDTIQKIVVTIEFLSDKKEVLKKNICLNIEVFPTANIKLNQCFMISPSNFRIDKYSEDELYRFQEQLGEKYGWRMGDVIYIPKLESLDEDSQHRLGIDIHYTFNYDADEQIKK